MDFPIQVTFHGIKQVPGLEEAAREQAEGLARFHPRLHGVRVVIGKAEGHERHGRYHVQVRAEVPGHDVVSGHHPAKPGHTDALLALSDGFRAVERMLEEDARIRRHDVKAHEGEARGLADAAGL
jgi:hypothetical protein